MLFHFFPLLILIVKLSSATDDRLSGSERRNLTVHLPYASYQGYYNDTSSLNVWLGVRYAASPNGSNRWRAPNEPDAPVSTPLIQANALPAKCPQNTVCVSLGVLGDPSEFEW